VTAQVYGVALLAAVALGVAAEAVCPWSTPRTARGWVLWWLAFGGSFALTWIGLELALP
jgi:hypothetical protein